jgi:hypothetical protein
MACTEKLVKLKEKTHETPFPSKVGQGFLSLVHTCQSICTKLFESKRNTTTKSSCVSPFRRKVLCIKRTESAFIFMINRLCEVSIVTNHFKIPQTNFQTFDHINGKGSHLCFEIHNKKQNDCLSEQ